MTAPRLRPAGRCTNRTCRAPMVQRPHGATVDVLPTGHRFHEARGLCSSCARRARHDGTYADYPRQTRSRDELLDDWVILRGQGHTYDQVAERMDITRAALDTALARARRDGDPRAGYALNRATTGVAA